MDFDNQIAHYLIDWKPIYIQFDMNTGNIVNDVIRINTVGSGSIYKYFITRYNSKMYFLLWEGSSVLMIYDTSSHNIEIYKVGSNNIPFRDFYIYNERITFVGQDRSSGSYSITIETDLSQISTLTFSLSTWTPVTFTTSQLTTPTDYNVTIMSSVSDSSFNFPLQNGDSMFALTSDYSFIYDT